MLSQFPARVRHLKRGTEYQALGTATAQASTGPIADNDEVVIYRGLDGRRWVRKRSEFTPDRFALVVEDPKLAAAKRRKNAWDLATAVITAAGLSAVFLFLLFNSGPHP